MKVSINWMKQFGGQGLDMPTDKLVEKIGAQLGAVEEVIEWGPPYDGIVVVKVITCEKHPNADKLSLCTVDDNKVVKGIKRNEKGHVQVVCGAPNVQAGMLAAWLPPGVTVPNTLDKDPFVLEARDIRGQTSNGMLASLYELGISDDHDGILEIDPADVGKDLARPGVEFKKLYGLDDYVIDIENKMFTHRPDCFGQLGVAREIAGISHKVFKSPDWYIKQGEGQRAVFDSEGRALRLRLEREGKSVVAVTNKIPKLCKRYMAAVVHNIEVKTSPVWLQVALARAGVRPINNIVDITNYVMLMTGQPLHAFDFDKIAVNGKANIVVRNPNKGEKMTLLDGKEIEPRAEAILICDQDKPIALGGVMGGNNSEIDENTKRIIIESANFDMYNIRKTSMEHGIFTDAVTRFNKGQAPQQCQPVLDYAIKMVFDVCTDANLAGKPIDAYPKEMQNQSVAVSADFVNKRLGTKLSLKEMAKLLENVEFKIKTVPADKTRLHVQAPFWRTDIEIPEDIVEEIGRLYGYDHLPLELPRRSIQPTSRNQLLDFQDSVRRTLSAAGANEVLTYTFVHGNLLEKVGQDPKDAFKLSNAISPELQYYRLSLLPSLLEKVHLNLKSDRVRSEDNEFTLFEINPVHAKGFVDEDGLPIEDKRLALVFAADAKTATRKYQGAAYYAAVAYLEALLSGLGVEAVFHSAKDHAPKLSISRAAVAPFDKNRTAIVKTRTGEFLGEIGEFSASTKRNLKLPDFVAGSELDITQLMKAATSDNYLPMPRFPKVFQDITLRVPSDVSYGDLYGLLEEKLVEIQPSGAFSVLGQPSIYQSNDDKTHKNVTLRLWISHFDRTLKAEEVNKLLDDLAEQASDKFAAQRI